MKYQERVYRPNQKRNGANTQEAIEEDLEWHVDNRTNDGNQPVSASGLDRLKDDRGLGVDPENTSKSGSAAAMEEAVGSSTEHAKLQQSEDETSWQKKFGNIKFANGAHREKTHDEAYRDIKEAYTHLSKYIDFLQGLGQQEISHALGLFAEYCIE